jgi:hypothetical protein
VATLPVSAGPVYVFLALDHGPAFISVSAVASLVSINGTSRHFAAVLRFIPRLAVRDLPALDVRSCTSLI